MLELFSDMAKGILELTGEDAFFTGSTEPVKVNIEHGVQLTGLGGEEAQYKGDFVANRDVATIEKRHGYTTGARFEQNGKLYALRSLVEDNGVTCRYVVMPG